MLSKELEGLIFDGNVKAKEKQLRFLSHDFSVILVYFVIFDCSWICS